MVDWTKPLIIKETGQAVELMATLKGRCICRIVKMPAVEQRPYDLAATCYEDGSIADVLTDPELYNLSIVNAPEEVTVTKWLNLDRGQGVHAYGTEQAARTEATNAYSAVCTAVPVTFTYQK